MINENEKIEKLKKYEIMMKEGRTKDQISKETGISIAHLPALNAYFEAAKKYGQSQNSAVEFARKNSEKLEKLNLNYLETIEELKIKIKEQKSEIDIFEKSIHSINKTVKESAKDELAKAFKKINYDPLNQSYHKWIKYVAFSIVALIGMMVFQKFQIMQAKKILYYTPSKIEDLVENQIPDNMKATKNDRWVTSGRAYDFQIYDDMSGCAIKLKK